MYKGIQDKSKPSLQKEMATNTLDNPIITPNLNQNNITFTGSAWKKEYDALKKALKAAKTDAEKLDIAEKLKDLSERAKKASETRVKNSNFETKMDNSIENFFGGVVKIANKLIYVPHLFQEYIEASKGKDTRVVVIGGHAVAWMERVSETDFRSNIELGGKGLPCILREEAKEIAEKVASVLSDSSQERA